MMYHEISKARRDLLENREFFSTSPPIMVTWQAPEADQVSKMILKVSQENFANTNNHINCLLPIVTNFSLAKGNEFVKKSISFTVQWIFVLFSHCHTCMHISEERFMHWRTIDILAATGGGRKKIQRMGQPACSTSETSPRPRETSRTSTEGFEQTTSRRKSETCKWTKSPVSDSVQYSKDKVSKLDRYVDTRHYW